MIKLILEIGTSMIGTFFIYDALTLEMKTIKIGKDPDCPLCGLHPRITDLTGKHSTTYESGVCRIM